MQALGTEMFSKEDSLALSILFVMWIYLFGLFISMTTVVA